MLDKFSCDDLDAIQLKVIDNEIKNYDHIKVPIEIRLPPMTAKRLIEYVDRIHETSCGSIMSRIEILNAVIAQGLDKFLSE